MPTYPDHISQAKRNLNFLESINNVLFDYTDWQVTVCFYVAVHLANARLSKYGLQYRSHSDVDHSLNPYTVGSVSKIPEDEYTAWAALRMLSRRSRYLVNEKDGHQKADSAHFTYDRHLRRALIHLDKLLDFFNREYGLDLGVRLQCPDSGSIRKDMKHIMLS